jgi:hypothetical protein
MQFSTSGVTRIFKWKRLNTYLGRLGRKDFESLLITLPSLATKFKNVIPAF